MSDIVKRILAPKFHAAHFTYGGTEYVFSGWWMLECDEEIREYHTKDEFIHHPVFRGKCIAEIEPELTDVWYEYEP